MRQLTVVKLSIGMFLEEEMKLEYTHEKLFIYIECVDLILH